MNLGFSIPWMLAGLAAALIPLVVHLLRRRPPLPTRFPALVLLLGPERRRARRRRLREWLLLATRMSLLAAVALALAGPYCVKQVDVPPAAGRQQAAVILVDDSLSMRYRRDGSSLFEAAKRRAEALLGVLPPGAPVGLLSVTGQGTQVRELSLDRSRLRRALRRLSPTWRRGDGADAVARALRLLESADGQDPRAIYLITDLTRQGLRPAALSLPAAVTLQVLDVAEQTLDNAAVVEATLRPAAPGRERLLRLRVGVRNARAASRDLAVRLTAAHLAAGGRSPWAPTPSAGPPSS